RSPSVSLFFLHDTAPTVIYTLSLHDALPIFETIMSQASGIFPPRARFFGPGRSTAMPKRPLGIETLERRCPMDASATIVDFDARSEEHTLNSSHVKISYAVFCLKKKKQDATQ